MNTLRRLLPLCAMLWVTALWAASTPSVPTVTIAQTPLFGQSQNIHPNLMMTLSVEFPTTGTAYRGPLNSKNVDTSYNYNTTYLGYFNAAKCYTYDSTNGYFVSSGNASGNGGHECSSAFSGNFMNWAASSSIDELRMAMTGGDRVVDTATQTVLQRAVLRSDFFRSNSYFPVKSVTAVNNVSSAPSAVTPFSYSAIYIASCGNHIFFSDADDSSGNCGSPGKYADVYKNGKLTERRSFRVQIQVCDSSEATTRTDLCYNYGSNYKPVGQMQRNADRVRFAAFGYLNDGTNDTSKTPNERYGGVLRAPMKYVGTTAVDSNLRTIANTAMEWDPATGVFYRNPLNRTEGISGVINYLNQFGRTSTQLSGKAMGDLGGPTDNPLGNYKTYDPISELFYESIRYLQFHKDGPTPQAISGLPNTTYADNFPVYTTWDADPMLNSCQRNYVVTIGDINTHEDHYIPGNVDTSHGDPARGVDSYSGFDVRAWTNKVGALETNTPAAGNANPLPSSFTNLGDILHPTSNWSTYYIAGVAYWAHTSAFRPDMPSARVTTFGIDVNEAGNGTVGATQRQSQIFLAAKYGGFKDDKIDGGNADGNPFKAAGQGGTTVTNNTEWEAAPTGSNVPSNWFLASQPQAMIDAIKKIFVQITSSAGTLSGIALTSNRIVQNGFVYTPGFDQKWNGQLSAYAISKSADGTAVTIAQTRTWEAGNRLASKSPSTRSIFTFNSTGGTGVPFQFTGNGISSAQQALLNLNPDSGLNDGNGQIRLNYLRGDRTQESNGQGGGGPFRARTTVFGDIIGSGPVFVGDPAATRTDSGYSSFLTTYTGRTPMVYVGANDGMLHGFNANTGDEVFAYVPNAIFSALAQLTSPSYSHRPYVDATPLVAEAQVNGAWKSVLAGGFGGGAQGIYALDVTDPDGGKSGTAFSGANVLWEFTDKDDADMGNVMGPPIVAKLQTGMDTNGNPVYKWFVVVGNGLNSNQTDGYSNGNAPAALFLLSLDKTAGTAWTLNSNYFKIVTPAPATVPPYVTANGLSTPASVGAPNGRVTSFYAGDLQGNLWKFNVAGTPSTWNGNATAGALPAFGGTPGKPMFVATDSQGRRQPITVQPQVVYAPGGYMVLFGTGKYYELSDTSSTVSQTNSFYGIYDGGGTNYVPDRSKLNAVTMRASADGKSYTFNSSAYAPGYAAPRKPGWVLDFLDSTERQVTSVVAQDGIVYFNSLYTGTDSCGTSGGSRSYALGALTGMPGNGVSGYLSSIGLLGAPSVIVINVTNANRSAVGGIVETKTTQVISFGASGTASVGANGQSGNSTNSNIRKARAGWREIRNFTLN